MMTSVYILLVLTALGLLFGFILAFANKRFAIEVNPLIHIVEDALPKGQCGACGYAGCMAYAEAVVLHADVPPDLCIPGKEKVAAVVAELTGKQAAAFEPRVAQVKCKGSSETAKKVYEYSGIKDCTAANLLFGGNKACKYGCLGLGSCVKNCPFGAIIMSTDGLPIINHEKCTGCGKCESICPKKVIMMMPVGSPVCVICNSYDKGSVAKKNCSTACIGCSLCVRHCPHNAITMNNNLAVVNGSICLETCQEAVCLAKCPTKALQSLCMVPNSISDNEKIRTREVN